MWKVRSYVFVLSLAATPALAQTQQQQEDASPVSHPVESLSRIESERTGVSYVIYTPPPLTTASTRRTRATPGVPSPLDGLSPAQISVLEKLNRVNVSRLGRLPALVLPVTWTDDELAYSPFPHEYAWAADQPKAIIVDQQSQAFGAYEYGRLVRWGPVSTGESGQTPSGLYQLSWRSRGHNSSVDPAWYLEWYFNFIPSRGIAFHKYSLPGRAASHGCVRMLERDAQWLFDWGEAARKGEPGTAVLVLGCPDSSAPWRAASYLERGIYLSDNPITARAGCGSGGAAQATQRQTVR